MRYRYPLTPKTDQASSWSVFPKLTELSESGHVFYDQSQVSLLNQGQRRLLATN